MDSGVDLHELPAPSALPDGRALVDERNLPQSPLDRTRRPIATVGAIGREAVTDPAIFDRAVDAVASVDADMVVVARRNADLRRGAFRGARRNAA